MELKHSLELLICNLTYHKAIIKKYSKPIASKNEYIQSQLLWHLNCKKDLENCINLIKKATE